MNQITPINIDKLELQSVPVTLAGKKYALVELDGQQRDQHLNDVSGRVRYTEDGRPQGMKNFIDLQSGLVAKCLHEVNADGSVGALVPIETVRKWPARVLEQLSDAAQKLSGLDKKDVESRAEAKNG